MNVGTATQREYFRRPHDERFDSMESLIASLRTRKENTRVQELNIIDAEWRRVDESPNDLELLNRKTGLIVRPTNWAFHQACAYAGAHATFLEELPAKLNVDIMNHLFTQRAAEKKKKFELTYMEPPPNQPPTLRAMTGAYYGRIWDLEVATALADILHDTGDRFFSPHDWGGINRALFAGDRDMHLLFVDGGSLVDGGGERDMLHRGFIIAHSEVGRRAWTFATFLFRIVCGNFGIHGLENVAITKIIHSMNAPATFRKEAPQVLMKYVGASAKPLEAVIKKAKDLLLPEDPKKFTEHFQNRKFTKPEIAKAVMYADKEEGDHRTLWQMYNGFTRAANDEKTADSAADLQRRSGKLLEQLAA